MLLELSAPLLAPPEFDCHKRLADAEYQGDYRYNNKQFNGNAERGPRRELFRQLRLYLPLTSSINSLARCEDCNAYATTLCDSPIRGITNHHIWRTLPYNQRHTRQGA